MSNICQFALFFIIFTLINALTIFMWLLFTKIFAQTNFNLINNVTKSLTYSLTHPLTHSLTHSLTHLLSFWPTHLRNGLLTHSLIYLWFFWYIIPTQQIYRRTPMLKCHFNKAASNFIEITLRHGCSPVNLQHIFRTPFPKNTTRRLFLGFGVSYGDWCWVSANMYTQQFHA